MSSPRKKTKGGARRADGTPRADAAAKKKPRADAAAKKKPRAGAAATKKPRAGANVGRPASTAARTAPRAASTARSTAAKPPRRRAPLALAGAPLDREDDAVTLVYDPGDLPTTARLGDSDAPPELAEIPAPPSTALLPDDDDDDDASTAFVAPAAPESADEVAARIRELEERLDRMIAETTDRAARRPARPPSFPPPPLSARALPGDDDPTVFDTARELLSTDFYLRTWGRLGMRNRSEEVDDFGYDPVYEERLLPVLDFLYDRWFRVQVEGSEHVPAEGRCVIVANHSGTVPFDGLVLRHVVRREAPGRRDARWLVEDTLFHLPFVASLATRIGGVRACQENAERLLRKDAVVCVFPEGAKGVGKLWRERYRLQRFGRGGFVKLCLRTRTPVVPVAIVGGEETNPLLARVEGGARALGLPYLPITPTFPFLGPLGLLPAPTKWRVVFGEPISFDEHGPQAQHDDVLVGRLTERVRATIQSMLDRAVGERRSVFFG